MSSNKQRKARQRAEREQWERDQERLAKGRRQRRTAGRAIVALAVAGASALALVVTLNASADPDPGAAAPSSTSTELSASEAAADAQGVAATEAMAAGEVVAEDFTVAPGTPVPGDHKPVPDDRRVACGAKAPANANATRPRYPGGPADVLQDGVDYVAIIATSCGPITIDLLETDAPVAVNSFVFLAEEGFYDGLEVFRDFGAIAAAQAGSGDNSVNWDLGYQLPDELDLARREGYPIGTVTTASDGPYSAGSEFLIAYGKEFDAGYRTDRTQTTFGRVLSGMDVIATMTSMSRTKMGEAYAERLFMESVDIKQR